MYVGSRTSPALAMSSYVILKMDFFVLQDHDVRPREDGEGLRHVVGVELESFAASRIRSSS